MEVFSIHLIVKNYSMYHLMPLMETWLGKEGFAVSVLANRVDGTRKTGFFSSEGISIFFEDHPDGCLVRMQGSADICKRAEGYLSQLPPRKITPKEEKVIIKEREIISVPCSYCGTLIPLTERKCPNCGSYIRK